MDLDPDEEDEPLSEEVEAKTDSLLRGKSDFDAVTFTAEALHLLSSITVASRKLPQ